MEPSELISPNNISTQSIDHLGLVADQIDQLELIPLLDTRLPINGNGSKISMGERVAGMIMNGLGFIDTRLYMFPDFLSNKPITRCMLQILPHMKILLPILINCSGYLEFQAL